MIYTISCVLLIPATMRAMANDVLEGHGLGPDNLSVALTKTADLSSWYGCHIWCDQAFLDFIQAHQAVDFLNTMIVSAVPGGSAYSNWPNTLSANGMTLAA